MKILMIMCALLFGQINAYAQVIDTVNMLVVYVKFKDDAYDNSQTAGWPSALLDTLPAWADSVVDSLGSSSFREGTISHFYDEMSYGDFTVYGKIHNTLFVTDSAQSWYEKAANRGYDYLNRLILDSLDNLIDYTEFDYNSDGRIDYIGMNYRLWDIDTNRFLGTPTYDYATGISSLGCTYLTNDGVWVWASNGETNYALNRKGCTGTLIHELGHNIDLFYTGASGLIDLYDCENYKKGDGQQSSGGGPSIMGGGSFSVDEPVMEPFDVYSRIRANFVKSANITTITGWKRNYEVEYIGDKTNGKGDVMKLETSSNDYFIAVNSQNSGYYDQCNPHEGLLIYHIDESVPHVYNRVINSRELHKMVDMECADGLWNEYGWDNISPPETINTVNGRDNLDHYIQHDSINTANYNGNQGDSTDFFDGVSYTDFTDATNPSSCMYDGLVPATAYIASDACYKQSTRSNVAIMNIRKKAGADSIIIADFYTNNWTGHIASDTTWSDSIHISGDIIIDAGATLTINAGTKIIVEPNYDDQNTGAATTDIEFIVNGSLIINGTSSDTVLITSCADSPVAQDWYGIRNYGIVDIEYCNIKYARTPVRNYVGSCKSIIDHCVLDSFYNYGVQATTGSLSVKNTLITNPSYSSARGLSLGTSNLTYLEVKDNTIKGFTGASNLYGIFLGSASLNTTISGNKLSGFSNGSNRYGIYLSYSDSITLSKNIIDGVSSFTKGIYLSGCDYCVIDDNAISYCTSRGIECYNSNTVNVYDNLLFDNGSSAYAIYMNGSSTSGDIDNNHICAENESYSCFMGICAYASAIGNVHNNTIEDFTDIGISTGSYGDSLFCGSSASHGNNNIYWNFDDKGSSTGNLLILSESASTTPAEYNYFGSSPTAANFYYLVNWSNYLSFPASDIMVGYYKMNTGSGSTADDECLLNNDGTISGASWVSRTPGYALDFDGVNDYVNITDSDVSNIFNNSSDFTIIAWVNPDSFPISGTTIDGASIVGQHYATSMVFGVRSDGKLFLSMDDTGVSSPKSGTALSKNQWQQVAVSYDNATDSCYFYIDGDGAGKGLIADNTIGVHDYLYIGWQGRSDPSYRPGYFNGGIDEVRIYNHVLEADEINALYDDIECVATKPVMPQITPVVPNPVVDPEMLVKVVPNPFTSLTELTFYVPKASAVKSNVALRIYNQAGELINEIMSASVVNGRSYQIKWDGSLENGDKAREGIYHYEYSADDKMVTGSIMLVK